MPPLELLLQPAPAPETGAPAGRFGQFQEMVCYCHRITEAHMRTVITETGAETVEQINELTQAGTACRGCTCRIKRMLAGLPARCSGFGLCGQCGCVAAQCACEAA